MVLAGAKDGALIPADEGSADWLVGSTADFIAPEPPTDREAWRREMDLLYNSLRRKLIVRLVVVRLDQPEDAIAQAAAEWQTILDRLKEINDERVEDISFATILVVASGDLEAKHKPGLDALTKGAFKNADHRIYLMTRKLELGHSEVLHAEFVWPVLVRGLLRHLAWKRGAVNPGTAEAPGFYAWRCVEFAFDIPERAVRDNANKVQTGMRERLTKELDAMRVEAAEVGPAVVVDDGIKPDEPAGEGTAWWDKPEDPLMIVWQPDANRIDNYSRDVRGHCFHRTSADATELAQPVNSADDGLIAADIRTIGKVLESLERCPFPQPQPFPAMAAQSPELAIEALGRFAGLDAKVAKSEELREASLQELKIARQHFVGLRDRFIIGAVIAAGLAFFAFEAVFVLHQVFGFLPVWQKAWAAKASIAAAAAIGGVATCAIAGLCLQRYRGRAAGDRAKKIAIAAQEAKAARVQESCRLLRSAEPLRPWLWRANLRRAMQGRFERIHEIVAREWLQPDEAANMIESKRAGSVQGERMRQVEIVEKAMRVIMPCAVPRMEPEQQKREEERASERFCLQWRELLQEWDPKERVFLPAPPVRDFFERFSSDVSDSVRKLMASQIRAEVQGNKAGEETIKERLRQLEGNFTSFSSVDLPEGSTFTSYLYASAPMLKLLADVVPERGAQELQVLAARPQRGRRCCLPNGLICFPRIRGGSRTAAGCSPRSPWRCSAGSICSSSGAGWAGMIQWSWSNPCSPGCWALGRSSPLC